jgi:hypothetical protein
MIRLLSMLLLGAAEAATLGYLAKKKEVDCGRVCKYEEMGYMTSMGMSGSGDVTNWNCGCSKGPVTVQCLGQPFRQCCVGKCANAGCPAKPKGWKCPRNKGCAKGRCSRKDMQWVAAHNVYRCMHDVPALSWSQPMERNTVAHFKGATKMHHSKSYALKPPYGPSGENLYWTSSGRVSPSKAVAAWYSEIKDCRSFPGCLQTSGTVGHFTAMIWQGAKTIGCSSNKMGIAACRYKAADYASCKTPNYGGHADYKHNIYAAKVSKKTCEAKVKACFGTAGRLYDEEDEEALAEEPTGLRFVGAGVAIAGVTMLSGAMIINVLRRQKVQESSQELLTTE